MALNKRQIAAIPYVVTGLPLEQIGEKVGITNISTIASWLKEEEFVKACAELEEVINAQRERAARRELEDQINDPNLPKKAKLDAAKALLTYRKSSEHERDSGVKVTFANLPTPKSGLHGGDKK